MQISKVEVIPMELKLKTPTRMAGMNPITAITVIFIRIETRQGQCSWGCTVVHPELTGDDPEQAIHACREAAVLAEDLHPTHVEYSLDLLSRWVKMSPAVLCAFDLAFHDLLSLAADMPLYKLLGGYRNRIQTSVTIPLAPMDESVEMAQRRASQGFRILKIKGGENAEEDVQRVHAIHQALPNHILRLDADGGYTPAEAVEVARALAGELEMFEQPTASGDLNGMREVKDISPIPVLADQSVKEPASALQLASKKVVDGLSVKLVTCGGLRNGRQIDTIARAAHITTMIGCVIEPAMLIAGGLSLALSSPNVRYGDLDGAFDLVDDPSRAGYKLEDGWLIATDVPGLGYTVDLD